MNDAIKRSEDGFPRELAPGIWWLGGCFPIKAGDGRGFDIGDAKEIHSHVASYLIVGASKALIVDTGTPANWTKLSFDLDQILAGRPLDYIVPTHWEVPHAGNLERLLKKYPSIQVFGDVRDFHLAYPQFEERLHIVQPGDRLELGGDYEFVFLPAPIKDIVNTVWGFEAKQRVLFPADGFGYTHHVADKEMDLEDDAEVHIHLPGECSMLSEELNVSPTVDQAVFLTQAALWWTRYTPIAPFFREMEEIIVAYSPRFIAPAHGNVISDLTLMLPVIKEAHDIAYSRGP